MVSVDFLSIGELSKQRVSPSLILSSRTPKEEMVVDVESLAFCVDVFRISTSRNFVFLLSNIITKMTSPPTPSLGYGNITGKELSLDQLVNILCTPAEFDDGVVPTILVVHDRGTKGGDEERLRALGVDINRTFWHVVDTQTLAQYFKPHPCKGRKWSLDQTFDQVCGLGQMTTQSEITQNPNDRPLHHNAQDDAWVTSSSMIFMVETRATELGMSVMNGPEVYILGLDFEGGNGPTTEIGTAGVCSKGDAYLARTLRTSHTIISEFIDRHPHKRAQKDRMGINDEDPENYPRWNGHMGDLGVTERIQQHKGREYMMSASSVIKPLEKAKKDFFDLFPAPPSTLQLSSRAYQLPISDPPAVLARATAARAAKLEAKRARYHAQPVLQSIPTTKPSWNNVDVEAPMVIW
ncbi:hypothetical protein D6D27_09842 [Aureobasidium pullulans]|nr:hypothetical protein D6D27_09842 [Aureobasidium pullulans]